MQKFVRRGVQWPATSRNQPWVLISPHIYAGLQALSLVYRSWVRDPMPLARHFDLVPRSTWPQMCSAGDEIDFLDGSQLNSRTELCYAMICVGPSVCSVDTVAMEPILQLISSGNAARTIPHPALLPSSIQFLALKGQRSAGRSGRA